MADDPKASRRVTMLPKQIRHLAEMVTAVPIVGAVSITQDGSTLLIFTGKEEFYINAQGDDITDKRIPPPC